MLWIQYRARHEVDLWSIRDIVNNIGELISPYPVTALDEGPFGVGPVVCDMFDSSSSSGTSNERPSLSPRIPNSISEPHGEHIYPATRSLRSANNTANNSKRRTSYGNGGHERRGTKRSKRHHSGNRADEDSMEGQEDPDDDAEEGEYPEDTPPMRRQRKEILRNDRFTGTATLCLGNSLFQELSISLGLRINPLRVGSGFADCQIILDPIIVRASTLFSDDETNSNKFSSLDHLYVTEQANILVGAHNGVCHPPVSVHPLQQHFTERRSCSHTESV